MVTMRLRMTGEPSRQRGTGNNHPIPCVNEHGAAGALRYCGEGRDDRVRTRSRLRTHRGAAAMNVWTWLKFVTFLWLLRKGFKLARWLMVVAAAGAVWPVTVGAGTGYAAAWLRGWPPVRVYRTAAWTLILTAAWLVALEASEPGFLAAREPGRTWGVGWDQLTIAGLVRTFAL